jgi:hypothetical protein
MAVPLARPQKSPERALVVAAIATVRPALTGIGAARARTVLSAQIAQSAQSVRIGLIAQIGLNAQIAQIAQTGSSASAPMRRVVTVVVVAAVRVVVDQMAPRVRIARFLIPTLSTWLRSLKSPCRLRVISICATRGMASYG